MWFSPRSRRIRCILNKGQPKTKGDGPCQDPSSAYHFFPSPPHEKPEPTKKPVQRQSKKMKKKRLADINKVWGLGKPEQKGGAEEKTSKEKCVTICSQPVVLCTPEPDSPEETLPQEPLKEADSSTNVEKLEISPEVKSSEEKDNSLDACPAHVSKEKTCAAEESPLIANETTPLKRGREQSSLPVSSQTKRCRRAEGSSSGSAGRQAARLEESPQGSPISQATEPKTPVQVSSSGSKLAGTAMKTRSSAAMNSPSFPKSPSTPSTSKACYQVGTPQIPSVFKSPGGANAVARRNYKGETLLHVASIKVGLSPSVSALNGSKKMVLYLKISWKPLHCVLALWGKLALGSLCLVRSLQPLSVPSERNGCWNDRRCHTGEYLSVSQCQFCLWALGSDTYSNVVASCAGKGSLWPFARSISRNSRSPWVISVCLTWPGKSVRVGFELLTWRWPCNFSKFFVITEIPIWQ